MSFVLDCLSILNTLRYLIAYPSQRPIPPRGGDNPIRLNLLQGYLAHRKTATPLGLP